MVVCNKRQLSQLKMHDTHPMRISELSKLNIPLDDHFRTETDSFSLNSLFIKFINIYLLLRHLFRNVVNFPSGLSRSTNGGTSREKKLQKSTKNY